MSELTVGEPAPDFSLPDQDGKIHKLTDYRGRCVVLYFYPRDNTPGCTREAIGFQEVIGKLSKLGVTVLGVSTDSPESHCKFRDKFGLTFPLLVDENAEVAQRYGTWEKKRLLKRPVFGVARRTFLIDREGALRHIFTEVKVDGHADEVVRLMSAICGE